MTKNRKNSDSESSKEDSEVNVEDLKPSNKKRQTLNEKSSTAKTSGKLSEKIDIPN